METDEGWLSFELTHVQYLRSHGSLGPLMAFVSLSPIFLVVSFVTVAALRRELQFLFFFAGQLANEVTSVALKHAVRQPRPAGSPVSGYGMPSSHAQFMCYFLVYGLLHLCCSVQLPRPWLAKPPLAAAAVAATLAVCASRVFLLAHSVEQVLCGAALGALFAAVYYPFVQRVCAPRFAAVVRHPVGRWLCLRDSTAIPNLLAEEHHAMQQLYKKYTAH